MGVLVASNLLKWGEFTSHSGVTLPFKIDCDALSDEDIECIAAIISQAFTFNKIIGIPTGGLRLAKALEKYRSVKDNIYDFLLIVDDVITTGSSMKEYIRKYEDEYLFVTGVCIFDRRKEYPDEIQSVFKLGM